MLPVPSHLIGEMYSHIEKTKKILLHMWNTNSNLHFLLSPSDLRLKGSL